MHSARFLWVFLITAFTVLLSACSESNLAGVTLTTFYEAVNDANMEKAGVRVASGASGNAQALIDEAKKLIQANGGLDRVEILKIEADSSGKSAAVNARLKFKNGKDQTETRRVIRQDDGEWKILP